MASLTFTNCRVARSMSRTADSTLSALNRRNTRDSNGGARAEEGRAALGG